MHRFISAVLIFWAAGAAAVLAADRPFALQNERLFFVNFKRGDVTGAYNPSGYSSADVEKVLDWVCGRGRLVGVAESPLENGLRYVEATCRFSDITGFGRAKVQKRFEGKRIDIRYRGTTNHGRIFRKRTF